MKSVKVWTKVLILFLIEIKMITMEPAWYETNNGKRFLIDTEEKYNWYQAWNECARYDAQLITIENEEKNHVVMKLLRNLHEKNKDFWIGGNVFYNKISFSWAANEQEFSFTNWAAEDIDKYVFPKQCVYIMRYRKNFPWNIANCDGRELGFICEEVVTSEEVAKIETIKEADTVKGSMYSGSIYGLIG